MTDPVQTPSQASSQTRNLKDRTRPYAEPARQLMTAIGVFMVASGYYSEAMTAALLGSSITTGAIFWMLFDKMNEAVSKPQLVVNAAGPQGPQGNTGAPEPVVDKSDIDHYVD